MSLKRHVRRLYAEQNGRCFYCRRRTWLRGIETPDQARVRLGIVKGKPGAGKELRGRMATAEHLERRKDGGTERKSNLVMACHRCNGKRGTATVEAHKAAMAALEESGGST